MKVRSIMVSPVVSVGPLAKVGTIARLLVDNDIDAVPVVDAEGGVLGMVSESDLIVRNVNLHFPRFIQIMDARIFMEDTRHWDEEARKMLGATARDIMTSPALVISPEAELTEAATVMVEKHVPTIPVVENGRMVGIVSRSDLVRLMADEEGSGSRG